MCTAGPRNLLVVIIRGVLRHLGTSWGHASNCVLKRLGACQVSLVGVCQGAQGPTRCCGQ